MDMVYDAPSAVLPADGMIRRAALKSLLGTIPDPVVRGPFTLFIPSLRIRPCKGCAASAEHPDSGCVL